jgi:hypothetical protein
VQLRNIIEQCKNLKHYLIYKKVYFPTFLSCLIRKWANKIPIRIYDMTCQFQAGRDQIDFWCARHTHTALQIHQIPFIGEVRYDQIEACCSRNIYFRGAHCTIKISLHSFWNYSASCTHGQFQEQPLWSISQRGRDFSKANKPRFDLTAKFNFVRTTIISLNTHNGLPAHMCSLAARTYISFPRMCSFDILCVCWHSEKRAAHLCVRNFSFDCVFIPPD